MKRTIKVGISLGDPMGIGPEVSAKALSIQLYPASFVLYGNKSSFDGACRICNLKPSFDGFNDFEKPIEALRSATLDILDGKLDLLVTAPLSKEAARVEEKDFSGHTEFLARLSSVKKATMMFVASDLKVSLVTTHIPLCEVPKRINAELLSLTIEHTNHALKNLWGIENPRIAICGINPHAGENGLFGNEEINVIHPTIHNLNSKGFNLLGPFGADTILTPARKILYDAVVSNFHDQLLPAIKSHATSVNLTLGLPFIRTSVDHGVGYDIYGKNLANPSSMIEAISLGIKLANRESH
ncbi:MAG: hypothetical protein A3F16_01835 [Deltaproteobacteria bacterium RIFCSPHIGHO2_12_FULL_43_9]|nr:MAG: hypothetical protein A3F16_01835 [Deltaproteobacteria bacterium RIFCSPHIGHO2_12_FULL_43_9]